MKELYADGGVVDHNPSLLGGTWAIRRVDDGQVVLERSGSVSLAETEQDTVSNNLTELLALIRGLESLEEDWVGVVYSDSKISLGRVFWGWKWSEIPMWMHHDYQTAVKRLKNWEQITCVLLDGHPNKKQLKAGIGKRGHPVSEHNVWCDKACGQEAVKFKQDSETDASHSRKALKIGAVVAVDVSPLWIYGHTLIGQDQTINAQDLEQSRQMAYAAERISDILKWLYEDVENAIPWLVIEYAHIELYSPALAKLAKEGCIALIGLFGDECVKAAADFFEMEGYETVILKDACLWDFPPEPTDAEYDGIQLLEARVALPDVITRPHCWTQKELLSINRPVI